MERRLKSKLPGGIFDGVSLERSRIMSAIRGKSNKSTEVRLRMALVRHGIGGWVLHPDELPGRPDFYFPQSGIAVFVDGCFWHGCRRCGHIPKTRSEFWGAKLMRNQTRDRMTNQRLRRLGVIVIRLWEHNFKTPQKTRTAVGVIEAALHDRRNVPGTEK